MNIKVSSEIISEFIERYNFCHIFVDKSLPLNIKHSPLYFNNDDGAKFLISAAVTGKKNIGFFNRLPKIVINHTLRGECLFICRNLPERVDIPMIFCREPNELFTSLVLALKVSSESKLAVVIVVSDNAFNNYTEAERINCDLVRTSPYLHQKTFKTILDSRGFNDCVVTAENILKSTLKPFDCSRVEELSFNNSKMPFFSYLLPGKAPDCLRDKTVTAPTSEAASIEKILNNSYLLNTFVKGTEEKISQNMKDFLCSGCPFVNIIVRMKDKNTVIFTDIECKGILKVFDLTPISLEAYMGLLSEHLNIKTLFIGFASNYKPAYDELLKNGNIIFLNDCGLSNISICTSPNHPKKTITERSSLFPYSCNNIRQYRIAKINSKKCRCINNGNQPVCLEVVKCPALYIKNDSVSIDSNSCTGCFACRVVCPFGAIR